MAELAWILHQRGLMDRVEQVNPQASFQPEDLPRARPTPYPLLPSTAIPTLPVPTVGAQGTPSPAPTISSSPGSFTRPASPRGRSSVLRARTDSPPVLPWPQGPAFDLEAALRNGIVCQPRTSARKQFSLLLPNEPDWLYKGPYPADRLARYIERVELLDTWHLPNVVLPDRAVFPSAAGSFLRFPFKAKDYPVEVEPTPYTEAFAGGRTYRVMRRTALRKAKDVLGSPAMPWAAEFIPTITYQLAALAILGVGDVNLSNTLMDVEAQTVYIVDIEENRTRTPDGPWFFFSSEPSLAVQHLWTQRLRAGLPSVLAALHMLPINDPGLLAARQRVISLLERYYGDAGQADQPPDVPTHAPSPVAASPSPSLGTLPRSAPAAAAGSPLPLGQMYLVPGAASLSRSVTFSGITLDVAKSGMQKYMRRGRVDDALMMAFEIYRFRDIDAKAVLTNLRHRLCIAVTEDVGPADIATVTAVLRQFLLPDANATLTPEALYETVPRIANAAKTRVCSWIARAYGAGQEAARALGVPVDPDDVAPPTTVWPWRHDDPPDVVRAGNLFYDRLIRKDANVYKWAFMPKEVWDLLLPKAWPGTQRRKAAVVLWKMVAAVLPEQRDLLDLLERAYWALHENAPFLRLALWVALYGTVPAGPALSQVPTVTLDQLMAGQYRIVVEPFVEDQHTATGRRRGMTRTEFTNDGAVVANEDPRFITPTTLVYQTVYTS